MWTDMWRRGQGVGGFGCACSNANGERGVCVLKTRTSLFPVTSGWSFRAKFLYATLMSLMVADLGWRGGVGRADRQVSVYTHMDKEVGCGGRWGDVFNPSIEPSIKQLRHMPRTLRPGG